MAFSNQEPSFIIDNDAGRMSILGMLILCVNEIFKKWIYSIISFETMDNDCKLLQTIKLRDINYSNQKISTMDKMN